MPKYLVTVTEVSLVEANSAKEASDFVYIHAKGKLISGAVDVALAPDEEARH